MPSHAAKNPSISRPDFSPAAFTPLPLSSAHSYKLPCLSRRTALFCGVSATAPIYPRSSAEGGGLEGGDRLLLAFDKHMEQVQGLTAVTRKARRRYARELLERKFGQQPLQLRTLKSSDLFGFVNERARPLKGTSLHALVVGLRSFLRFLEFTNRIRQGLAHRYLPGVPARPAAHADSGAGDATAILAFLCSRQSRRTA